MNVPSKHVSAEMSETREINEVFAAVGVVGSVVAHRSIEAMRPRSRGERETREERSRATAPGNRAIYVYILYGIGTTNCYFKSPRQPIDVRCESYARVYTSPPPRTRATSVAGDRRQRTCTATATVG